MFEPFFCGRYRSAIRAVSITRGSATINVAPLSFAFTMRLATMGWLAAGLYPMSMMQSVSSSSGMLTLMAPDPTDSMSPMTEAA